jgi:hypothetical protein
MWRGAIGRTVTFVSIGAPSLFSVLTHWSPMHYTLQRFRASLWQAAPPFRCALNSHVTAKLVPSQMHTCLVVQFTSRSPNTRWRRSCAHFLTMQNRRYYLVRGCIALPPSFCASNGDALQYCVCSSTSAIPTLHVRPPGVRRCLYIADSVSVAESSVADTCYLQRLVAMPDVECYNNSTHYFVMGVGAFGLCTYTFGNPPLPLLARRRPAALSSTPTLLCLPEVT